MRYLYKITNKINGKCYIGQTTDFKKRIHTHIYTKSSSLIHKAILKYGKDNFIYEVLFRRHTTFIDVSETVAIKYYNSLVPNGYNLESGGCINKKHCQNTKLKMSISKKGKKILKLSLVRKGKPHPHKGVPCTAETKLKMSIALSGRIPWNKGKPMADAQKIKCSLAQKGKKLSKEHKDKIALSTKLYYIQQKLKGDR